MTDQKLFMLSKFHQ